MQKVYVKLIASVKVGFTKTNTRVFAEGYRSLQGADHPFQLFQ